MYRKTWMEINLDEIKENFQHCANICKKRIIAVLKADGYGCGDHFVAKAVIEAGADMLAVSSLDEAIMLRNEQYNGPLLIFGPTEPEDCDTLIANNISVTAFSMEWIEQVLHQNPKGLKIHLKHDTGMNRIGFKTKEDLKLAFDKLKNAGCNMEGIYTHFYCADVSKELTLSQFHAFEEAVHYLNYSFAWIHCDNSDATVSFQDPLSNACRVGESFFGISAFEKLKHPISLYTEVAMVKVVPSLETIGYGATYQTSDDEIIATLPIGYADGFVRANSGRNVYIDGQFCKIVGRVCMDQIMIKLEKEVPVGTKVEIFGEHIPFEEMAEDLHTIPDEIISLISDRVPRVYTSHGEIVAEINAKSIKSKHVSI